MALNTNFSREQIDKLGNLVNYLASRIPNLYLTKLLKLLYITDEISVTETGAPVTWLKYFVWQKGPVASDIYYDITLRKGSGLSNYVNIEHNKANNGYRIRPVGDFDDSEFSDYEITLLNRVISEFGKKNSGELIDYLHEEHSLWSKVCEENDLKRAFEEARLETSDYEIALEQRIRSDAAKMAIFNEVKESLSL